MAPLEKAGYQRVKELLAAEEPPPSLLILAADSLRKERILQSFAQKFFGSKETPPLRRMRGGNVSSKDLTYLQEESQSLSLFASRRFLVIDEVDQLKTELSKDLTVVLEKLPRTGLTVFLLAQSLPTSSVLHKFHTKCTFTISLDVLSDTDLRKWSVRELTALGVATCSNAALESLLALADGNLDLLSHYLNHAALFSNDGTLDEKDIAALFPERVSANEFELFELLARGNAPAAELLLSKLIRAGKNPFLLLSLLSRTYLTYYSIRAGLDQGHPPTTIGARLRIPPWLLQKHLRAMSSRSRRRLTRDLEMIIAADSRLKNRSLGPDTVLSTLLSQLAYPS